MSTGAGAPRPGERAQTVRDILNSLPRVERRAKRTTRSERFHAWLDAHERALVSWFGILGVLTIGWPEVADALRWPLSDTSIRAWFASTLPFLGGATWLIEHALRAAPCYMVAFVVGHGEIDGNSVADKLMESLPLLFLGTVGALVVGILVPLLVLVLLWGLNLMLGAADGTVGGISTAWQWASTHLGLVLGVAAGVVALLAVLLGWLFWEPVPGDKGDDPVSEFFRSLGATAKTLAIPAAGAGLIGYFDGMSWFSPVFQWCWGWWYWPSPESIPERIIIDLACGIVSILATIALFIGTFFAGLGWFGYRALVLAGVGWWKLAIGTSFDPLFAAAIALGAVFLGHRALKSSFGVNPVLLMMKRTGIMLGHGFENLILMFSRERSTPAGTHANKESSMPEPDDDFANDPEIKQEWRKVEPFAKRVHEEMHDGGPVPTTPSQFRGLFQHAKERATVRWLTKLDRKKAVLLREINEALEQIDRYYKKKDEIIRFRKNAKTRDALDDLAFRTAQSAIKDLDLKDAQNEAQIAALKERKSENDHRREAETPAQRIARDIESRVEAEANLDDLGVKLAEKHPGKKDVIERRIEHERERIRGGQE